MHFMNQLRRIKQVNSCANPRMECMGRHSQASQSVRKTNEFQKEGSKGELKSMTAVARISLTLFDGSCSGIYFNK